MSEYPVPPNPAPDGLLVSPVWTTLTTPFDAMTEQRKAKAVFAKYDVSLKYPEGLDNADIQTLWAFYMARRGAYQTFYIYDLLSQAHTGLFVGWGDGTTTTFDLPGKSTSGHTIYIDSSAITLTDAGITDTVDLANIRLSLVNGTAFVDFSAAGTLTPYLNHRLTLTDSAGKKAVGYIKAAGSGETLGSELITNGTFASDVAGWYVTAPTTIAWNASGYADIARATGNGLASQAITAAAGILLKGSMDVKALSHGAALRYIGDNFCTASGTGVASGYRVVATANQATVIAATNSTTATLSVDDVSVKQVLTPSATGVTITSTPGGTTYNWASIEAGFNYNDEAGYTYEISKGAVLTGGGAESSDRISFAPAPTLGKLITCDLTGYLRMRVRFKEDKFSRQSLTHLISAGGTIELKGLSPEDV